MKEPEPVDTAETDTRPGEPEKKGVTMDIDKEPADVVVVKKPRKTNMRSVRKFRDAVFAAYKVDLFSQGDSMFEDLWNKFRGLGDPASEDVAELSQVMNVDWDRFTQFVHSELKARNGGAEPKAKVDKGPEPVSTAPDKHATRTSSTDEALDALDQTPGGASGVETDVVSAEW